MAKRFLALVIFITICHASIAVPNVREPGLDEGQVACLARRHCVDQYFSMAEIKDVPGIVFERCRFDEIGFSGDLGGSVFKRCLVSVSSLTDATFLESTWIESVLWGNYMGGATDFTFERSTFKDSSIDGFLFELYSQSSFRDIQADDFSIGCGGNFTQMDFSGMMVVGLPRNGSVPVPKFSTVCSDGTPSIFVQADFHDADLSGGILAYSNFSAANFANANLSYVNMYKAQFDERTNFTGADLRGAVGLLETLGNSSCHSFCADKGCSCNPINYCESAEKILGPGVECEGMRMTLFRQLGDLNDGLLDKCQLNRVEFVNEGTTGRVPDLSDDADRVAPYFMNVSNLTLRNSWMNLVQFVKPKNQAGNAEDGRMVFDESILQGVTFSSSSIDGLLFKAGELRNVKFQGGIVKNVNYSDILLRNARSIVPLWWPDTMVGGFWGPGELYNPIIASNIRFDRVREELDGDLFSMKFDSVLAQNVTVLESNFSWHVSRCPMFKHVRIENSILPALLVEDSVIQDLVITESEVRGMNFSASNLTDAVFDGTFYEASFGNALLINVTFVGYPDNFVGISLNGSNVLNTIGLFSNGACEAFCKKMRCCCEGISENCPTLYEEPTSSANSENDEQYFCFSGSMYVELEDGSRVRMGELELGDHVRVSPTQFSEVYLFGHKNDKAVSTRFLSLTLQTGQTLEMSDTHFLYVNGKLQPAKNVKVGDFLAAANGQAAIVGKTERVIARGLYNPHTLHGDIVVNGIVCSSYTSLVPPMLAHTLLVPVRFLYRLESWNILGSILEQGWKWRAWAWMGSNEANVQAGMLLAFPGSLAGF